MYVVEIPLPPIKPTITLTTTMEMGKETILTMLCCINEKKFGTLNYLIKFINSDFKFI